MLVQFGFGGEIRKKNSRHSSGTRVQCWLGSLVCCGLWRAIHHGEQIPQSGSHRARLLGQIKGSTIETLKTAATRIGHLFQTHPRLRVGEMLSLVNSSIMATDSFSVLSLFFLPYIFTHTHVWRAVMCLLCLAWRHLPAQWNWRPDSCRNSDLPPHIVLVFIGISYSALRLQTVAALGATEPWLWIFKEIAL